jgi:hypothetical protein
MTNKGKVFVTWRPGPPGNYPPVRTLRDMTEEEIVALEKKYGVPVKRPDPSTCNRFEAGRPILSPETVPSQSFNPPKVRK